MAITGAAAIAAGVAGTVGAVSTTAIMVAGLAITAVGIITKNPLLMKIGGGIGLGSGVAGAASGVGSAAAGSAAAGSADATSAAVAAPSIADAAGAGSQAVGDVAANTLATGAVPGLEGVAYAGSSAGGLVNGATTAGAVADAASTGATGALGNAAPVDSALQGAGDSISQSMATPSQASQSVASDVSTQAAQAAGTGNVNPSNAFTPNSIAANTNAPNAVAPGSQVPTGAVNADGTMATTGSGAPMGFSPSATPIPNGLQDSGSWWTSLGKFWNGLDSKGQLAVGQTAAGLVQGVGQGALTMMGQQSAQRIQQQQQDFEHANMSGAGSVPKINTTPSGAASPYATPAQIQQTATSVVQPTVTPAFGLVNRARGK